jgi:hypothetical protein
MENSFDIQGDILQRTIPKTMTYKLLTCLTGLGSEVPVSFKNIRVHNMFYQKHYDPEFLPVGEATW